MTSFPTYPLAPVGRVASQGQEKDQGDQMEIGMDQRLRRREVLGLLGAGAIACAAPPSSASAQGALAVSHAAATGVNWLRAFYLFNKLPVPPTSALPGTNWEQFDSGELIYLVPPDWKADGPPTTEDPNRDLIYIESVAIVAPRASAAWMTYFATSLGNGTADQAASFGLKDLSAKLFRKRGAVTISVERRELEGATITFEIARWGTMLAVARGGSHVSGTDLIFYDAMVAPESRFTAMTRSVFLPLIYEHIGGGGRGATPAA